MLNSNTFIRLINVQLLVSVEAFSQCYCDCFDETVIISNTSILKLIECYLTSNFWPRYNNLIVPTGMGLEYLEAICNNTYNFYEFMRMCHFHICFVCMHEFTYVHIYPCTKNYWSLSWESWGTSYFIWKKSLSYLKHDSNDLLKFFRNIFISS